MTTPSTTAGPGHDVYRLTVTGPRGRADLAVPATVTVAGLLPVLLGHVAGPESLDGCWVLQRLGEPPLDPDGTPASLDLRDGDVLHVRPADAPLAELHFDDLAEGLGEAVGTGAERWRPELTRRLLTGIAAVALALLAVGIQQSGAGRSAAGGAAFTALVLTTAGVLAAKLRKDRAVAVVAGLGGVLFAAGAGAAARHGATGLLAPGRADVALAGLCAAGAASVPLFLGRLAAGVFGAATATALGAVGAVALAAGFGLDATRASAVLAVAVLLGATPGLRLALRAARLRVPRLPRNTEELQRDIEPDPAAGVHRRARLADTWVSSTTVAAAGVITVACLLLARVPDWAGPTLAGVLGAAALLRARSLVAPWQRGPMAVCGALAPALVLLSQACSAHPVVRAVALLVLLAAAVALLHAASRRGGPPTWPVWGHAGDLLETWTAVLLIPLLLQLLHVYARVRALAG
ncbi:type VII secretion integral membrane protein EccD [Kitasatospora sp. NPDC018058]|uniref:type VII secretion integral membrane protein EccD n=1 Tax=Kitasatospora sp. NPDC018058 TaxID=3364025 RepID=UPI0037C0ED3A